MRVKGSRGSLVAIWRAPPLHPSAVPKLQLTLGKVSLFILASAHGQLTEARRPLSFRREETAMADAAGISELIDKMTAERARLLAALEALGEDAAAAALKPGEWSAKQQMSHLCEMETAYRAWVQGALEEDGAIVDEVYGEPAAIPVEQAN